MLSLLRGSFIAACLLAAVTLHATGSLAEEAAQGHQENTQAAPAQKSGDAAMPGCADSETGTCCSACQEKAAQAQKDEPAAPADCPCRHAKHKKKSS